MSIADKMLKKIGYKKIINSDEIIQYEFEGLWMDSEIIFDLKGKTVRKEYSNGESQEITMQELQAICEMAKELGWNA